MFKTAKQLKALMEWLGLEYQGASVSQKLITSKPYGEFSQRIISHIPQGDFCQDCGGFFKKDKLQKVEVIEEYPMWSETDKGFITHDSHYSGDGWYVTIRDTSTTKYKIESTSLFCPTHAKPYDKQVGDKYYKLECEVTKEGKMIK